MTDSSSIRPRDAALLVFGGPALVFVSLTGYGFDGIRAGMWAGALLLLILAGVAVATRIPSRDGEASGRSRRWLLALLIPFLIVLGFFVWFAYALAQDPS
jgi:hypothetical protein